MSLLSSRCICKADFSPICDPESKAVCSMWPVCPSLSHTTKARRQKIASSKKTQCLWSNTFKQISPPPNICHCLSMGFLSVFKGGLYFKNTKETLSTRVLILVWECYDVQKVFFKNSTPFCILLDLPSPLILINFKRTEMLLQSHDAVEFLIILLFLKISLMFLC